MLLFFREVPFDRLCNAKKALKNTDFINEKSPGMAGTFFFSSIFYFSITIKSDLLLAKCCASVHFTPLAHLLVSRLSP